MTPSTRSDTPENIPRKTRSNHPLASAIAWRLASVFFLLVAYGAWNRDFGGSLEVGHWDIEHLSLFLGVLGFTSALTAFILSKLPRRWSTRRTGLTGTLIWLLIVLIFCMFAFRYPANFKASYWLLADDNISDVREKLTLDLDTEAALHYGLLGSRTAYTLAAEPVSSYLDSSKRRNIECISNKTYWLFGLMLSHSWEIIPWQYQERLENAHCQKIDPAMQDILYKNDNTRYVYP